VGRSKAFKLPGGPVYSKAGMMMFPAGNAIYRRETYDNYPARAPSCSASTRACSCRSTPRCASNRATSPRSCARKEAAAMIRSLFLSMQELNKGARRPPNVPPTKVKKIGVIGAGFMGAGVGYVSARAGIEVVLIDRDQESADKGKAPRQA
jgi:3-hydroxyacyl-CoA dehydrogenase/enoyl-CoA hydratase/3-hydroxybutyryl-CoA epimerase